MASRRSERVRDSAADDGACVNVRCGGCVHARPACAVWNRGGRRSARWTQGARHPTVLFGVCFFGCSFSEQVCLHSDFLNLRVCTVYAGVGDTQSRHDTRPRAESGPDSGERGVPAERGRTGRTGSAGGGGARRPPLACMPAPLGGCARHRGAGRPMATAGTTTF